MTSPTNHEVYMKLFHVNIEGYPCKHVVSTEPIAAIALVNFWLYEREHQGDHTIMVKEVDPQLLNRLERVHLAELLAEGTAGFAYYEPEEGWTLYDVSDDPNR
jgi:hypothetical protein